VRDICIQNITEKQLKSYGHMTRREEKHIVRRVINAETSRRSLGQTKTRWYDTCRIHMEMVCLATYEVTEKENYQPYQQPQMSGKDREEETYSH